MVKSSPLGKNAYLVVTDLHISYQDKPNRFSYKDELKVVLDKIRNSLVQLKNEGYTVVLIFLGDLFDRSFRSVKQALVAQSQIYDLASCADYTYTLVGNHEFTYSTNNPFWSLVDEISSYRVMNRGGRNWKSIGKSFGMDENDFD